MLTSKKKPIEHKTSEAVKMCVLWNKKSTSAIIGGKSEKKGVKISHWKRSLGCEMRAEWKDSHRKGDQGHTTILQDVFPPPCLEWFCVIKYALKRLCARCFADALLLSLSLSLEVEVFPAIRSMCTAEGVRRSQIRKCSLSVGGKLSRQSPCDDVIRT